MILKCRPTLKSSAVLNRVQFLTTQLELMPGQLVVSVQVIIYDPEPPKVIETTGSKTPDGQIIIDLPIVPPPPNTPIQVIIYDGPKPTIIEGTTTRDLNGYFGIDVPDGLVD